MKTKLHFLTLCAFLLILTNSIYSQTTKLWTERYFGPGILYAIPTYSIYGLRESNRVYTVLDAIDENNLIMVDCGMDRFLDSFNLAFEFLSNIYAFRADKIKKSIDGGVNWFTIYPFIYKSYTNFRITTAQYLNKDWIFFSGETAYQRDTSKLYSDYYLFPSITYSSNGGRSWEIKKLDTIIDKYKYREVVTFKMIDSLNGYAVLGSSKSYSIIQTSNCWNSFNIVYFVKLDSTSQQGISSFDIYNTGNLDSVLVAFSDQRNFVLYSSNGGKNVSSFKFNNHKIEQIELINRDSYLVLATDSGVVNPKNKILKGSQKIYITHDRGDTWELFYQNDTNQLIMKMICYNKNNISLICQVRYPFVPWKNQLLQTSNGGMSWEEQDITSVKDCLYIDSTKQYVFGSYTNKGLVNFQGYPIIYFTKNNKALKRPTIKINNEYYPNDNNALVDKPRVNDNNCVISWNKIEGADKYKLKIYGEHSSFWLGPSSSSVIPSINLKGFDYSTNYTSLWYNPLNKYYWKEHKVIEIVTPDTSYNFENVWRNMVYGVEVTAVNKSTNIISAMSFLSFFSDTTLLPSPEIINPKPQSTVTTKDLLINWTPIENAESYNLIVWTDQFHTQGRLYDIFLRIKDIKTTQFLLRDLDPNKDYYISLSASNNFDISEWRHTITFTTSPILSVSRDSKALVIFPNPARSSTRISLLQEGDIIITAIDVLGRSFSLWTGFATAGEMELDVSLLPKGSYTLLINYGTKVEAVRMMKE